MSLNDPTNVLGMGSLLADTEDTFDVSELEKSILLGVPTQPKKQTVDFAREYKDEITKLERRFSSGNISDELDKLIETTPKNSYKAPYNLVDNTDIDLLAQSYSEVQNRGSGSSSNVVSSIEQFNSGGQTYHASNTAKPLNWSPEMPEDPQLSSMTIEERKKKHLDSVMQSIETTNDDAEFMTRESDENEMAVIMEQIDLLRSNLELEGVDLSRVPEVGSGTSKKEAKSILYMLQIKNDRLRYCDFIEEGVLALAYAMEQVFNGQNEYFGKKIDLTGYSETVKVKLRRMRYDTSRFIHGIMQNYNIGPGARILLELIPSALLYSRDRKLTNGNSLYSDEAYKKAMQELT